MCILIGLDWWLLLVYIMLITHIMIIAKNKDFPGKKCNCKKIFNHLTYKLKWCQNTKNIFIHFTFVMILVNWHIFYTKLLQKHAWHCQASISLK